MATKYGRRLAPLNEGVAEDWAMVAWGAVVSGIVSFMAVKWLLGYVQSHSFRSFGVYDCGRRPATADRLWIRTPRSPVRGLRGVCKIHQPPSEAMKIKGFALRVFSPLDFSNLKTGRPPRWGVDFLLDQKRILDEVFIGHPIRRIHARDEMFHIGDVFQRL